MERRDFLKVLGIASGGVAASWSSGFGQDKLVSRVLPPPEGHIPGEPVHVHSVCTECPAGCGLTVTVRDGLPVKLEGNPHHAVGGGALCVRGQASLVRVYHPERVRRPLYREPGGELKPIGWDEALGRVRTELAAAAGAGRTNAFWGGRSTASLHRLIGETCATLGLERLPEFEIYHHGALRGAYGRLFGRRTVPAYRIDRADALLTVGADIVDTFLSPMEFARQIAPKLEAGWPWFHAEPALSLTGARAARRLAIAPGSERFLLAWLLRTVPARQPLPAGVSAAMPSVTREEAARTTGVPAADLDALAHALTAARQPLVVAGGVSVAHADGHAVALLAGLLQWSLGAIPALVDFSADHTFDAVGTLADVRQMAERLTAKRVGVLFLSRLHGLELLDGAVEALPEAAFSVGLTDFLSPAFAGCRLILPVSQALESWGDAEPQRGRLGLIRPVFRPLHGTRSEGDILLQLAGKTTNYKDYLFEAWRPYPAAWWKQGYVEHPVRAEAIKLADGAAGALAALGQAPEPAAPVLVVAPSLRTFDGRSRVIPLLHEIPDPLSTVTYGPWVNVPPGLARSMGLADGDELRLGGAVLPVRVLPGLPDGVMLAAVDAAAGLGLKADPATGELLACRGGISAVKTGRRTPLPFLSGGMDAAGRGILPGDEGPHHHHEKHSLYEPYEYVDYRWAMAVDLDRCIGCSACVAACYMENNIPVAGPEEHLRGREMSWLRVQPYVRDGEAPVFIPVMCQHCDAAPCETVCPVYATYHNEEGLNVQVYNRCVGTRYCNNNCPFKARRFNWFEYDAPAPLDRLKNPDVSVRPKGVMEKCTFCIQRIAHAKDKAKDDGRRKVRDGEIVPACAQTCPAGAITFGNILDEKSRVYQLAHSGRAYRLLEMLGTEPAVYYLSKKVK